MLCSIISLSTSFVQSKACHLTAPHTTHHTRQHTSAQHSAPHYSTAPLLSLRINTRYFLPFIDTFIWDTYNYKYTDAHISKHCTVPYCTVPPILLYGNLKGKYLKSSGCKLTLEWWTKLYFLRVQVYFLFNYGVYNDY